MQGLPPKYEESLAYSVNALISKPKRNRAFLQILLENVMLEKCDGVLDIFYIALLQMGAISPIRKI